MFEERVRIARELHDVVAHHVSMMGVQAGAARLVIDRDPDKAKDALSAIEISSRQAWTASYDVRLSSIVASCLLVEAVVAKEALDVKLDYFSQLAAVWVFIAYLVTGRHDKSTARAFALAAVLVTAAVLGLYAP